tara:strand:- start:27 stop:911 length:885 start_codon:yes stop_codon:yes gene_type:complete
MALSKVPVVAGTKTLTRGSIVSGNASGEPAALAIGSNGQVLKSDGTDAVWGTDAGGAALTGSTNNTVTTVTGANAIQGEANLTFDGTVLKNASGILRLQNATTGSADTDGLLIEASGNEVYINNKENANMYFRTNNTTNLTITDSGYLVSPPTYGYTSGQSANVYINSSGTFKRSTSALKYKTDVRDLESIDISSFRPIRYKSNVADDDPNEEFIGFIADEFHNAGLTELVSYSVSYAEDDIKKENPIYEVEGFNYDRLTAILTKSLQNSQTKITALETNVADLTTRLEALENA